MAALARSAQDHVFLGVCGGLAEKLNMPSRWMRAAFIIAAFASGVGILLYLLFGLFMLPPGYHDGTFLARVRTNADTFFDAVRDFAMRMADFAGRILGSFQVDDLRTQILAQIGGIFFLLGVFILLVSFDLFWWLTFWRALGLASLMIGLGMLVRPGTSGQPRTPESAPPSPTEPPPYTPPAAPVETASVAEEPERPRRRFSLE